MHILTFRHVPFEHLGLIAESLREHAIECRYVDLRSVSCAPNLADAAGLVFMGGPMSANDDLPYIRQEVALIQEAISLGKPVLGVCLGAQLIAKAMGSRVYPNGKKEIGWYPVRFAEGAATDRLFGGLTGPELVFHWHGETFDLPSGAELLASSDYCRNQAFRAGVNVYGLQFHLEVTPDMISDWCRQDANCGDMREVNTPIDPDRNAARLRELSEKIFGAWCRLVLK
jgi:GMP synthase-like glutamine amidotransferase